MPCVQGFLYKYNTHVWIPRIFVIFFSFFAAPSSPRNVRLLGVTDTTIKISWWEPARANGLLLGYRIYFLHRNFTSVQTIRDNKSAMVETLTRLSKFFFIFTTFFCGKTHLVKPILCILLSTNYLHRDFYSRLSHDWIVASSVWGGKPELFWRYLSTKTCEVLWLVKIDILLRSCGVEKSFLWPKKEPELKLPSIKVREFFIHLHTFIFTSKNSKKSSLLELPFLYTVQSEVDSRKGLLYILVGVGSLSIRWPFVTFYPKITHSMSAGAPVSVNRR